MSSFHLVLSLLLLAVAGCSSAATPNQAGQEKVEWTPSSEPAALDGLQVRVAKVYVGKVPFRDVRDGDEGKDTLTKEDAIAVQLEVKNSDDTRKINFSTFRLQGTVFSETSAVLVDNFGNKYNRVSLGFSTYPTGSVTGGTSSIYPGKSLVDIVVFEKPIDTAKHLSLELPGEAFGSKGDVRFRIPLDNLEGWPAKK